MFAYAHKTKGQNFEVTCSYAGVTESSTFRAMELFSLTELCHDIMGVEDYMREVIASMDMNELMGITDAINYVYYAEGNKIYSGISWNMDMTAETFRMEDGVLFLFENGTTVPTAFYPVEEVQE